MRIAGLPGTKVVAGVERDDLRELALERRVQDRREDGVRLALEVNQAF
jgi:hypothetical protein